MKQFIAFVLALTCVLGLTGCASSPIADLSRTAKIEIIRYDLTNGEEIGATAIAGAEEIKHICDNLSSLKLKKMEHTEPTVREYQLTFYDTVGEQLEVITIPVHDDWIGCGGYFHSISNGELDRAFLAELMEIAVSAGPKPTE